MRGMGTRRAPAITEDSTINDVCKWAGLPRSAGGVGLSVPSVAILRREEITGTSLFEMSAAELRSVGLTSGAHTDLLAAITRLREPQAFLQAAVPFLASVPWDYQESPENNAALREGLLLRYTAWMTRTAGSVYAANKKNHPVFTVYAGPGSGKSSLLSVVPKLALAAAKDIAGLAALLDPSVAYVFHVGFENGTKFQICEKDGEVAVGNRMMWQLVRPEGVSHGFAAFAKRHAYSIGDVLDKLSMLTRRARVDQPVFLLVDGIHNLCVREADATVFRAAVVAISTAICSSQFVVGVIAATSGLQLETLFGKSKQKRVFLRPPLLPRPDLVVPNDAAFPALCLLRDDMGGHGRALEILATLVHARKSGTGVQTTSALSSAVQSSLQSSFSDWMNVQPVEALLEAIVSRRPFHSLADRVVGDMTVDTIRELGLVQWHGPGPLIAPVILLLMMQSRLPCNSLLLGLASGYNKLEFGSRSGTWWQDFEEFVAVFRAIKAKAFRGAGWVSAAQLHSGAKLSAAVQALRVRTPQSSRDVAVVRAAKRLSSKSSGRVHSVIPWVMLEGGRREHGAPVKITDGAVIVLNGTSAKAADIFLDLDATQSAFGNTAYRCREVIACRHRDRGVSAVDFVKECRKAADHKDLFLFFNTSSVNVSLSATSIDPGAQSRKRKRTIAETSASPDLSKDLVGFVDASCFGDYFGFGGRAFASAGASSADAESQRAAPVAVSAVVGDPRGSGDRAGRGGIDPYLYSRRDDQWHTGTRHWEKMALIANRALFAAARS